MKIAVLVEVDGALSKRKLIQLIQEQLQPYGSVSVQEIPDAGEAKIEYVDEFIQNDDN